MADDPSQEQKSLPTDFECLVVTPDKILFEGKVNKIMAPGISGLFAILPQHAPFYTELAKGSLTIESEEGSREIEIEGGLIRARSNTVTIVVGF